LYELGALASQAPAPRTLAILFWGASPTPGVNKQNRSVLHRERDAIARNAVLTRCIFLLLTPIPTAATGSPAPSGQDQAVDEAPRLAYNTVFVEGGGSGLGFSLNYDRMIGEYFSLRAGIGAWPGKDNWVFTYPILFNVLVGSPIHKLEIGAGIMLYQGGHVVAFALGYRLAPKQKGLAFRIAWTPFFPPAKNEQGESMPPIVLWAGVSLGMQF
jgi:hypothetical protein